MRAGSRRTPAACGLSARAMALQVPEPARRRDRPSAPRMRAHFPLEQREPARRAIARRRIPCRARRPFADHRVDRAPDRRAARPWRARTSSPSRTSMKSSGPRRSSTVGGLGRREQRARPRATRCTASSRAWSRAAFAESRARRDRDVHVAIVLPLPGLRMLELDRRAASRSRAGTPVSENHAGADAGAAVGTRCARSTRRATRRARAQARLRPQRNEAFVGRVVDPVLHDREVARRYRRAVRAHDDEVARVRAAREVVRVVPVHHARSRPARSDSPTLTFQPRASSARAQAHVRLRDPGVAPRRRIGGAADAMSDSSRRSMSRQ